MAFTTTFEASAILEDYLLQSARAVARVAQKVEGMSGMTPQDAQVLSAVLLGVPQPSASDVVNLTNFKRRKITKDNLPPGLLSAISVSRFLHDCMSSRVGAAVRELYGYMGRVFVPGKESHNKRGCGIAGRCLGAERKMVERMRARRLINIGLSSSGKALVAPGSYKFRARAGSPDRGPGTDSQLPISRDTQTKTKERLTNMLSALGVSQDDLESVVDLTVKTSAVETAEQWAGLVSSQVSDEETIPKEDTITKARLADAIDGLYDMYNMFRDNILKTASQLTNEEDIVKVQSGMKRCVDLINANVLERVITALLFYSCFKDVSSAQDLIGREGEVVQTTCIEKRGTADIFMALCFFFQSFPACYADILHSLNNGFRHRTYAEGYARNLLTGYSGDTSAPWTAFNEVLDKKREIALNRARLREDVVESRVNLSGPMYVVIYDALDTIRELVEGLENFLIDVREKQILFDKYLDGLSEDAAEAQTQ